MRETFTEAALHFNNHAREGTWEPEHHIREYGGDQMLAEFEAKQNEQAQVMHTIAELESGDEKSANRENFRKLVRDYSCQPK